MNSNQLGKGNTADVYEFGEGKILKLFNEHYPKEYVKSEYYNARLMQNKGLPVPNCYELVEIEGRHGIVYERVKGREMFELLMEVEFNEIEEYFELVKREYY